MIVGSVTGAARAELWCYGAATSGTVAFSRTHEWFIYQRRDPDYPSDTLRIARLNEHADRNLLRGPGRISAWALSPDEAGVILSTFRHPDRDAEETGTWIVRRDGTGLRRISGEHILNSSDQEEFDWAPDSNRVVFRRPRGSLVVLSTDTGALHKIAVGSRPRWSPDGRLIAYQFGREIRTVRPDGRGMRRITRGRLSDWSPDARRLAYWRKDTFHRWSLWVRRLGGQSTHLVQFPRQIAPYESYELAWSPRGARIAFAAYDRSSRRHVLRLIGSTKPAKPRRLVSYRGFYFAGLSWSRDGGRIVYLADGVD
jgi:hypothetical protein